MATINKVIEYVDGVKPNTFGKEEKFQWLCDLDGMVKRLVIQDESGVDYRFPDDMDKQLLVGHPFENLYALYLEAQIDLHNREYEEYNNSVALFNNIFLEYRKAYLREHRPKSAGAFHE